MDDTHTILIYYLNNYIMYRNILIFLLLYAQSYYNKILWTI